MGSEKFHSKFLRNVPCHFWCELKDFHFHVEELRTEYHVHFWWFIEFPFQVSDRFPGLFLWFFSGVFICMSIDRVLKRFPVSFSIFWRGLLRSFYQRLFQIIFWESFLRYFSQGVFSDNFLRGFSQIPISESFVFSKMSSWISVRFPLTLLSISKCLLELYICIQSLPSCNHFTAVLFLLHEKAHTVPKLVDLTKAGTAICTNPYVYIYIYIYRLFYWDLFWLLNSAKHASLWFKPNMLHTVRVPLGSLCHVWCPQIFSRKTWKRKESCRIWTAAVSVSLHQV